MPDRAGRLEAAPLIGAGAARTAEELDAGLVDGMGLDVGAELGDADRGRLLLRRAELRMFRGEFDGAVEDVQGAGELLPDGTGAEVRARLLVVRLLCRTMRVDRAVEVLSETKTDAKRKGVPARLALALATGELALEQGKADAAFDHLRRAAGLARDPGAEHDLWQAVLGVATACQLLGDPAEAMPWLERGIEVAREVEAPRQMSESALALGNLRFAAGDEQGAGAAYKIAVDGDLPAASQPLAHLALGRLALDDGDLDAAVDLGVKGAQAGAAVGNHGAFADGAILAARAQGQMGRPAEARKTLDAGITVLERQNASEFAKLLTVARTEFEPTP